MKFILPIAVVLVVIAGGFFIYQNSQKTPLPAKDASDSAGRQDVLAGAHVIMRTKDGFVPAELTIQKGETVTWQTDTNEMYWPASNLHPSHLDYPEFDPKEPVQPDHVWSFTFEKTGEWKYHDHLAPYFTGVITVTE